MGYSRESYIQNSNQVVLMIEWLAHYLDASNSLGNDDDDSSEPSFINWSSLWKSNASPRAIAFTWKALKFCIPTKDLLIRRGMDISPICDRCHLEFEELSHALFGCNSIVVCWDTLGSSIPTIGVIRCLHDWILAWNRVGSERMNDIPLRSILISAVWSTWRARNQMIFEGCTPSPNQIMARCMNELIDFMSANLCFVAMNQVPINLGLCIIKWRKPLEDWFKINFDGCCSMDGSKAGYGFIVRNSYGSPILAGAGRSCASSSLGTELQACWSGILHASEISQGAKVWIEGDAKVVTDWLLRGNGDHYLVPAIVRKFRLFASIRISHIHREGNRVADTLASMGTDGMAAFFGRMETLSPVAWLA